MHRDHRPSVPAVFLSTEMLYIDKLILSLLADTGQFAPGSCHSSCFLNDRRNFDARSQVERPALT